MFTSLDDLYFAPLTEAPAGGPQKFQTALIEYFGARGTGNEDTPAVIAFFNGRADLYAADVNHYLAKQEFIRGTSESL
jgi:hypothetical protein